MGEKEETTRGFQLVGDPHEPDSDPSTRSGRRSGAEALPPMAFGTFVLSLSASAAVHLGMAPDPEGSEPAAPNLPLAQQTIDILEMLHEKTKGNLEPEELRLLESVLHDLRLHYVEAHAKEC